MNIPLLLLGLCGSTAGLVLQHNVRPSSSLSFDYVIVGGGTAGLTLANRLSEDSSVTVAVIEAGTYIEEVAGNLSAVPAYSGRLEALARTDQAIDWGFKTTPQPGLGGAVVDFERAKVFGGCSTFNALAYSRGPKGAFQLWADSVGDQSYIWDEVLPYYKKSMNFTPPSAARFANATPTYDTAFTAQGGPLDITYPAYAYPWSTWVAEGLKSIGLPSVGALVEGTLHGSTYQLLTVNPTTGHRASSDTAFLRPVLERENLFVFKQTMAEKVLFSWDKVATGVVVTAANSTSRPSTITANKEVILSAGVIQSPQLLMVSGIGPAAVLQQHHIEVIADLPGVGQGLLDHILIPITWRVNLEPPDTTSAAAAAAFNLHPPATGPLTNPGGDYAGVEKIPAALRANWSATATAALAALPDDWPEVEYLVRPFAVTTTTDGATYATLFLVLQAPQSVGNVSIAGASMRDAPVINPNWMTARADLEVMLAAVRRVREMASRAPFADVVVGEEVLPGLGNQTDAQLLEYFGLVSTSIHHGHATNRMGRDDDGMAVLGSTGIVRGVQNLRVVDASAFPFLMPGPGPQGHIYMLAEKLADAIKQGI